MPKFSHCPPEVYELAKLVLSEFPEHFKNIEISGIRIHYYFATPDLDDFGWPAGNAITVHGIPAAARCKKLSPLDRVKTQAEIEILIDADYWDKLTPRQQQALLHHELTHIDVDPVETCDDGRPKVRIRKHDFQFGWFNATAAAFARDSIEVRQAETIIIRTHQLYFTGMATAPTAQPTAA